MNANKRKYLFALIRVYSRPILLHRRLQDRHLRLRIFGPVLQRDDDIHLPGYGRPLLSIGSGPLANTADHLIHFRLRVGSLDQAA